MAQTLYRLVFIIGCNIILNVFDATAQYFPTDANAQSVRITSFGSPYNANSFSSNIQLTIPSSFDTSSNQQLFSNNYPSTSNAVSPISATGSSPLFLPSPNAFTRAVLGIPSLQRFLNLAIPRFQAADLLFNVTNEALRALGHPNPAIVANIVAQHVSSLKSSFTVPIYFELKGNTFEKFLPGLGINNVPSLAQSFENSIENSLNSSILDSEKPLLFAIHDGLVNFVQSLGLNFVENAYILALVFHEEVIAAIGLKP